MLKEAVRLLRGRPKDFSECIAHSRKRFEKLFNHDIRQLLHVYPIDAKTSEGALFWSLPKRTPTPLIFDPANTTHCAFVAATACLRARLFFIEIPSKTPRTEEFRANVGAQAALVKVSVFVPNDSKAKEI